MSLKNLIKRLFLVIAIMAVAGVAHTISSLNHASVAQAAVVGSIDVRGNQRVDDITVGSYLTIKPGQRFSSFDIDDSTKALFATGLFSDVSIYQQGSVLVVEVDENATVNKIFFEGNNRLKDDALTSLVGLREQGIYSDEQAALDVERIDEAYGRVGRRGATVSYEVLPLENNRVNVIYRVVEGDKTKVASIVFIGNDTFSERHLRDVISTKQSTILSFLQTNDVYDPNRLNADEEALRSFYFNRGFADFQILSTTADLNDVDNEYVITFTFDEGQRYTFGNIDIDSTIPNLDSEQLRRMFETIPGEHYSAKDVEDTVVNITRKVSEDGFPFVEVVPRGNRDFDNNTIDVVYLVDEGARVFIEDISIVGNDRTRGYVIRREFEISEGDAYNKVLIQKTRDRIQGLGFFENVDVSTRPGSSPDRVRVIVNVIEKSTGDISLSGGYSTNGGATGEVSLTERNFLGRGQFMRVSFQSGEDEQSYGFQFTEPYFLGQRISAGISLNSTSSEETSRRQYAVDSLNGRLTFGFPITEDVGLGVFYAFNSSDIRANGTLTDAADDMNADTNNDGINDNLANGIQGDNSGELSQALFNDLGSYFSSGIGYNLVYNTLDNNNTPREGVRASLTQTFYGVGGDANYLRTEAAFVGYHLLSEEEDVVLFGRVRGGHILQFGGDNTNSITDTLRTSDNFKARGNTIRGFEAFGYGPRDPLTGDALGGRTYWNATAEVQFPLPFISRSLGLRGAFFGDAGQLFDPGDGAIAAISGLPTFADPLGQLDNDSIRASVGASVIWDSPFGPLRLDYAFPIANESYDKLREINFGVSTAF